VANHLASNRGIGGSGGSGGNGVSGISTPALSVGCRTFFTIPNNFWNE
jgi:hypothetical protein